MRIALLAMLLLGASVAQAAEPARIGRVYDELGRYQLFQGSYTTFDLKRKESYTHQAVFLLDSATGQVKRYINKIDEDGRYIETWVPTEVVIKDKKN